MEIIFTQLEKINQLVKRLHRRQVTAHIAAKFENVIRKRYSIRIKLTRHSWKTDVVKRLMEF